MKTVGVVCMQCTVSWVYGIIATISLAANVGIGEIISGQKLSYARFVCRDIVARSLW